jgi:hypothetical protein
LYWVGFCLATVSESLASILSFEQFGGGGGGGGINIIRFQLLIMKQKYTNENGRKSSDYHMSLRTVISTLMFNLYFFLIKPFIFLIF